MGFNQGSTFYCTKCGKKGLPVLRRDGRGRGAGHLKKLYCIYCKEEVNHAECIEYTHYSYDDFLFEFENGNFTDDGLRNLPYGLFRDKMHKEGYELP